MPFKRWKEDGLLTRSERLFECVPLIVAGTYTAISFLWIATSDAGLSALVDGNGASYEELQTLKGWLFVAVSGALIYFVLGRAWKGIFAAWASSIENESRLKVALSCAGGGVWEIDLAGDRPELGYVSPEILQRLGLPEDYRLTLEEMQERRHPDDAAETGRRLALALASRGEIPYDCRYRIRAKDGLYHWIHVRGNVVGAATGLSPRMIGVALDIDAHVKAEAAVQQLRRYDPFTGLSKQSKFLSDIDGILPGEAAQDVVGVLQVRLLDVDNLVEDAETLEDAKLVRVVGDRLRALDNVFVSRIAPDVFAVANATPSTSRVAQQVLRNALKNLLRPIPRAGSSLRLRVQAGGAVGPEGGATAHSLLRNSGHALQGAQKTSEVAVRWFNEELSQEFRTRSDRMSGLERAVAEGEIECRYQPLVNLETGRTAGFEALARWRRKEEGLVPPESFISLAEEVGKICEIGEEVLRQACSAAAAWPHPHPFVAVNVSPLQLEDPAFPAIVARVLAETGLSPRRLELEITENALAKDPVAAAERVFALRDLGVDIAIDDFGTGYSSLALLGRMPFTRLKIDRSFVSGDGDLRENAIIVDAIIDLAQNLGMSITAEGIETPGQAALLAVKGADLGQGFHFSKPVTASEAVGLVGENWQAATSATRGRLRLRLAESGQEALAGG